MACSVLQAAAENPGSAQFYPAAGGPGPGSSEELSQAWGWGAHSTLVLVDALQLLTAESVPFLTIRFPYCSPVES